MAVHAERGDFVENQITKIKYSLYVNWSAQRKEDGLVENYWGDLQMM